MRRRDRARSNERCGWDREAKRWRAIPWYASVGRLGSHRSLEFGEYLSIVKGNIKVYDHKYKYKITIKQNSNTGRHKINHI